MDLKEIQVLKEYELIGVELDEASQRHLANMGVKSGSRLQVLSIAKDLAIVKLGAARFALDHSIIQALQVRDPEVDKEVCALTDLQVGDEAYIEAIHAQGFLKRRLMDMGLTRKTKILLYKVAPLGDPLEVKVRGYDLTLRKSEASLISVVKEG